MAAVENCFSHGEPKALEKIRFLIINCTTTICILQMRVKRVIGIFTSIPKKTFRNPHIPHLPNPHLTVNVPTPKCPSSCVLQTFSQFIRRADDVRPPAFVRRSLSITRDPESAAFHAHFFCRAPLVVSPPAYPLLLLIRSQFTNNAIGLSEWSSLVFSSSIYI